MNIPEIIRSFGDVWDHIGPTGIGFGLLGFAIVFVAFVSWKVLSRGANTDAMLATSQKQLVDYVTKDNKELRNAVDTNSIVTKFATEGLANLKVSLDDLSKKMVANQNCSAKEQITEILLGIRDIKQAVDAKKIIDTAAAAAQAVVDVAQTVVEKAQKEKLDA